MKYILAVVVAIAGLSIFGLKPAIAESPIKVEFIEIKELTVEEKIVEAAKKYGVNPKVALAVAKCESGLDPLIGGDKNTSWGLYQIHLPAHPTVSREQATDEDFAINWAMPRLKTSPQIWTCWRKLYGVN